MAVVAVPLALGALGAWAAPAGYAAIGFAIGSAIGSYLVAPTVQTEGPRLSDNSFQASQYGVPINRVYGRSNIKGHVIWSSGIEEHSRTEDVGGKGGGGTQQTTYTYTVSFAILLCEGEISAIRKLYIDGALAYDISDTASLGTFYESFELFEGVKVYLGDETQTADPILQSHLGTTDVPGYRGWCYLVFEDFDVTNYGRLPLVEAEVVVGVSPTFELFSSGVAGYDHGYNFRDGADDVRVDNGIIKFAAPTIGPVNPRKNISYTGFEYSMPVVADDHVASPDSYDYAGLSGFTACFTWIMGRIGGLRVLSDRPDSGTSTHPFPATTSTKPYMRIEGVVYYDSTKYAHSVCSNDQSILYAWVFDRSTTNLLFMDVYDSSLNLLLHDTSPAIEVRNQASSSTSAAIDRGKFLWYYDTDANVLYIYSINSDYSLTLVDSTNTQVPDFLFDSGMAYVKNNIFFHVSEVSWKATAWGRLGSDSTVDLADIVSDICVNADLAAGDIDVTDLVGIPVTGYRITNVSSARSQIQPLQIAFNFDAVASGGKITFVVRGATPTKTLTIDDLGATADDSSHELVTIRRVDDMQLPKRVTVTYANDSHDGEVGSQYAIRSASIESISEGVVEMPILMTDQAAARIAEIQLFQAWNERTAILFSSNDTSLKPTDVVTIDVDSIQYVVRIVRVNYQSVIGPVDCEAVLEDISVYSAVADGAVTSGTTQELNPKGPTKMELFDSPMLLAQDGEDGVYIAARGYYPGWPGTVLMISDDNASWTNWLSITSESTMGRTLNVLASAGSTTSDEINTVSVILDSGSLSTVTELQWLNGHNAALIGNELVLFRVATLTGTNEYELSGLIRGVRGTEQSIGTHVVGERFVRLQFSILERGSISIDKIDSTLYVKPVTIGRTLEETDSFSFTYEGNGYRPYAPAHLSATDVGSGNYDIAWVRRSRKNAEWRDYVDVPMNEETESYRVEVWRTGSLFSTTDVSVESATVAAQSADVIKVAQISAVVGPGIYSEVTI